MRSPHDENHKNTAVSQPTRPARRRKTKDMGSLRETFIDQLKDVLDAEKQILRALPKLARAAEHEELKAAFEEHRQMTEGQIERLERAFEALGQAARGKKCKGMQGLIEEGAEHIQEKAGDAALIAAAQKVEHYEIAAYGSLAAWAELMEEDELHSLMTETLAEEKETDEKLTEIAERIVNPEEHEEDEEEEKPRARKTPAARAGARRR